MTREELIEYLANQARQRTRARSAVWWNGELIPIEEAVAKAADLQEGDTIQLLHGEIIVNALLQPSAGGP